MTKNEAIIGYLKNASKVHGIGAVILLPEFTGSDDSGWTPVASNGVRAVTKGANAGVTSFIRLGSVVLGNNLRTAYRYTNDFLPTNELVETLDMLGLVPGSKVPGKLIAHERLIPFSPTNAERDIKYAGSGSGLLCTFTGTHNGVVYDTPAPIYRRIEHKMNTNTEDILIAHTNEAALIENARAKWVAANVKGANTGMDQAKMKAAKIAELQAIPKGQRTAAQKVELAELLEPEEVVTK